MSSSFDNGPYVRAKTLANAALSLKALREEDFVDLVSETLIAHYGKERAMNLIQATHKKIASVQISVPVQSRTIGDTT